jgi:hypothetical protein
MIEMFWIMGNEELSYSYNIVLLRDAARRLGLAVYRREKDPHISLVFLGGDM